LSITTATQINIQLSESSTRIIHAAHNHLKPFVLSEHCTPRLPEAVRLVFIKDFDRNKAAQCSELSLTTTDTWLQRYCLYVKDSDKECIAQKPFFNDATASLSSPGAKQVFFCKFRPPDIPMKCLQNPYSEDMGADLSLISLSVARIAVLTSQRESPSRTSAAPGPQGEAWIAKGRGNEKTVRERRGEARSRRLWRKPASAPSTPAPSAPAHAVS